MCLKAKNYTKVECITLKLKFKIGKNLNFQLEKTENLTFFFACTFYKWPEFIASSVYIQTLKRVPRYAKRNDLASVIMFFPQGIYASPTGQS